MSDQLLPFSVQVAVWVLAVGVPSGFILGIVSFGIVKKITKEVGFWAGGICFAAWGFVLSVVGVVIEVTWRDQVGLILIVLGGVWMAFSGLFVAVGIKFEGRREAEEKEKRLKG